MDNIKPWSLCAYQLIFHGEVHYKSGEDYDRRMAIISFDNAIEITITTYLNLNPRNREGKSYPSDDVTKYLKNYHTKLDFFFDVFLKDKTTKKVSKEELIWYHDQRNSHYHEGVSSVPAQNVIQGLRTASVWIFSELFKYYETEKRLKLDIQQAEAEKILKTMPEGFKVPTIKDLNEKSKVLSLAVVFGGFDENNVNDKEIIGRMLDEI